ncbi:MAG: BON domain-containing protein [Chloroflexota bacterium]|nr:BON domain-containing protein [Chloroflexota bacterium]
MLERWFADLRKRLGQEPPPRTLPVWPTALGVAAAFLVGMVAMYFLDPRLGRGRRAQTVDRTAGTARQAARKAGQAGRFVAAQAYGVTQKVRHLGRDAGEPENDAVLKSKVESILFRDPDLPKGDINIHAEDGVVVLKGTARTPDEINEIERRVAEIDGVQGVRNMLHLPNMPDPQWQEAALRG